ncbi:MAG: DUF3016 domain-containing protein [Dokdonella sp.]
MKLAIKQLACGGALALLACGFIASNAAAESSPTALDNSPVSVTWTDPQKFSDTKSDPSHRPIRTDWIEILASHLKSRAARRLQSGQHLTVTFTDIQRAGRIEPWRGPNMDSVRIVKDIYPPSIDLSFSLTDADGKVLDSGDRKLRDVGFLSRATPFRDAQLQYEKRLLDDWLNKEFPRSKHAT